MGPVCIMRVHRRPANPSAALLCDLPEEFAAAVVILLCGCLCAQQIAGASKLCVLDLSGVPSVDGPFLDAFCYRNTNLLSISLAR